jgi:hypothetical protein
MHTECAVLVVGTKICVFFSNQSTFRDANSFLRRHAQKDTDCVESFMSQLLKDDDDNDDDDDDDDEEEQNPRIKLDLSRKRSNLI